MYCDVPELHFTDSHAKKLHNPLFYLTAMYCPVVEISWTKFLTKNKKMALPFVWSNYNVM